MKQQAISNDLRALALEYSRKLHDDRKISNRLGNRHRGIYFAVSIAAVFAGAAAGVAGLVKDAPLAAGIAGFIASGLTALSSTLDSKRLAEFHFAQGAEYEAIGSLFEVLAIGPVAPAPEAMQNLIERLAACRARTTDEE